MLADVNKADGLAVFLGIVVFTAVLVIFSVACVGNTHTFKMCQRVGDALRTVVENMIVRKAADGCSKGLYHVGGAPRGLKAGAEFFYTLLAVG